ncbi:hypothetical protein GSI_04805 [Ganoderma sinense ZZ0214-1]|uniref:Uncharacterized protein n=1 Tax=Ganoderma sinense ZZ0214-1 TaxID=1077348 RepID=A0A2G8SHV2_9APHY|nr:hypothetical protein GSI_04805 [Ganoderma sinense ZZ0214-1]
MCPPSPRSDTSCMPRRSWRRSGWGVRARVGTRCDGCRPTTEQEKHTGIPRRPSQRATISISLAEGSLTPRIASCSIVGARGQRTRLTEAEGYIRTNNSNSYLTYASRSSPAPPLLVARYAVLLAGAPIPSTSPRSSAPSPHPRIPYRPFSPLGPSTR